MKTCFRKWIDAALAVGMGLTCAAIEPPLDTELNDLPGTLKVGEYIQAIASNQVSTSVILTNGVLTVNGEAINIAEPTKMVIITNGTPPDVTYTTNYYPAVYQDELEKGLTNATNALAHITRVVVVTNTIDGQVYYQTNEYQTSIAYLDDLQKIVKADDAKADKIYEVWEFYCPTVGVLLKTDYIPGEPVVTNVWKWTGEVSTIGKTFTSIEVSYYKGQWTCLVGSEPETEPYFTEAALTATPITFNNNELSFVATNFVKTGFVVYSDYLNEGFVAKTNLAEVARAINEENLYTIDGIASVLRGIKSSINGIVGGSGIQLVFSGIRANDTLTIGPVEMHPGSEFVDIDWGDGNKESSVRLPASHTYQTAGTIIVSIMGDIKAINQGARSAAMFRRSGESPLPWCSFSDGDNSRLIGVMFGSASTVSEFGAYSFTGCSGLTTLAFIPSTVQAIGNGCFSGCSGIKNLAGYPITLTSISDECFSNSGLDTLAGMPAGITSIGIRAFADCYFLTSCQGMASSVSQLGVGVFAGCYSMDSLSGLPQSLEALPAYCFASNRMLHSISALPSSVRDIGAYCFFGCLEMNGNPVLPIGVTNIGEYAFYNCQGLASIKIPLAIESVGANAFFNAGLVQTYNGDWFNLDFGDGNFFSITNMAAYPWGTLQQNVKVKILGLEGWLESKDTYFAPYITVTEIGFGGMTGNFVASLNSTTVPQGTTLRIDWGDGDLTEYRTHSYYGVQSGTIKVYGKIDSLSGYSSDRGWISFSNADGGHLTKVEFGNAIGVTEIGAYSFVGCSNLTGIVGLNTLQSIGNRAFQGCSGFATLSWLPSSVNSLGTGCFAECMGLASLDGLESLSLTSIPSECFFGCTSLATLTGIPLSIGTIGDRAFMGCETLSDISAIQNCTILTSLGTDAFNGCSSLTSLETLPSAIESVGIGCFANCTALASITGYPSAVTRISDSCFSNCIALTSIEGMSGVTEIGDYAFRGCRMVSNIVFTADLSSVGEGAFMGLGSAAPQKYYEEAQINYTSVIAAEQISCSAAKELFSDASVPHTTIIVCSNGTLSWDNVSQTWFSGIRAIAFTLANVAAGQSFNLADNIATDVGEVYSLDWGDGTLEKGLDANHTSRGHVYQSGGTYQVVMRGPVVEVGANYSEYPCLYDASTTEHVNTNLTMVECTFHLDDGQKGDYGGIEKLGDYCFANCDNLESLEGLSVSARSMARNVKVPHRNRRRAISGNSTITTIGRYCFNGCKGLRTIAGLPSSLSSLPEGCFANCTGLETLNEISPTITSIGSACFDGCENLTNISALAVATISANCFRMCTKLDSVVTGGRLTGIEDSAFYSCTNLSSLSGMQSSVSRIGKETFASTALTNLVGFSTNITSIPEGAFRNCDKLEDVTGLEKSKVSEVDDFAFLLCTNLIDVSAMPTNITKFGDYSFGQCMMLSNGTIGASCNHIGEHSFLNTGYSRESFVTRAGMLARTEIQCPDISCTEMLSLVTSQTNENPFIVFSCYDGAVLYEEGNWVKKTSDLSITMVNVPANKTFYLGKITASEGSTILIDWGDGTLEKYRQGRTNSHSYRYPQARYIVRIIGNVDKMECDDGSQSHVPFIRYVAGGNPHVAEVAMGAAMKIGELGQYCFAGCTSLTTIEGMSEGQIEILGEECFRGCSGLQSLRGLPDSISGVGTGCFMGCSALANLDGIPIALLGLSTNCFADCVGLLSLTPFSQGITMIGPGCFSGCLNLADISGLYEGIGITISDGAFRNCKSLQSLNGVGTNVVSIGDYAFAGCDRLQSLAGFEAEMTALPEGIFHSCLSLNSLVGMPTNVAYIGTNAFEGCTALKELTGIATSVVVIASGAFRDCALTSLVGVATYGMNLGEEAFAGNVELKDLNPIYENTGILRIGDGCFKGCTALGSEGAFLGIPTNTVSIGNEAFSGCSLKNILCVPPSVRELLARTFSESSFTNLYFNPPTPISIGQDAFTNQMEVVTYMLDGFETSRIIYMTNIDTEVILKSTGFPWGANDTTRFVGKDGDFIIKYNGIWDSFTETVRINACLKYMLYTSEVSLNEIIPASEFGIIVEWGDGTRTNLYAGAGEPVSARHKYQDTFANEMRDGLPVVSNREVVISIKGKIDTIGRTMPFITAYGGHYRDDGGWVEARENLAERTVFGYIKSHGVTHYHTYPPDNRWLDNLFYTEAITVTTNSHLKHLGPHACEGMLFKEVPELPETVETVGEYCFSKCGRINNVSMLPCSITNLGYRSFYACTNLTNVVFTSHLLSLPENGFEACPSLLSAQAVVCRELEEVSPEVFNMAVNLQSIDLSYCTNITKISNSAFLNCSNLKQVIFGDLPRGDASTINLSSIHPRRYSRDVNGVLVGTIVYFQGATADEIIYAGTNYSTVANQQMWHARTNVVKFVGSSGEVGYKDGKWQVFYGKDFLWFSSINVGDSVVLDIETRDGCVVNWGDGLSEQINGSDSPWTISHTYGRSATTIAFSGNLVSVTPHLSDVFYERLTDVSFSDRTGYSSFVDNAYLGCTNLLSVYYETEVTNIGTHAFYACSNLSMVAVIPTNALLRIGHEAFGECWNLSSLDFGRRSIWTSGISNSAFADLGGCNIYAYGMNGDQIPSNVIKTEATAFITKDFGEDGKNPYVRFIFEGLVPNDYVAFNLEHGTIDWGDGTAPSYVQWLYTGALQPVPASAGLFLGGMREHVSDTRTWAKITNYSYQRFIEIWPNPGAEVWLPVAVPIYRLESSETIRTRESPSMPISVRTTASGPLLNGNYHMFGARVPSGTTTVTLCLGQNYVERTFVVNGQTIKKYVHEAGGPYTLSGKAQKTIIQEAGRAPSGLYVAEISVTNYFPFCAGNNPVVSHPKLKKVIIGNGSGVNKLGDYFLAGSDHHVDVIFEDPEVLADYMYAYSDVSSLEVLPRALEKIPNGLFYFCTNLTSLVGCPTSVKTIGKNAFAGCENLTMVGFNNSQISHIGIAAFSGAGLTSLNNLLTNGSYAAVADRAFENCKNLSDLGNFLSRVKKIPYGCFAGCTSLPNTIFLPSNIEKDCGHFNEDGNPLKDELEWGSDEVLPVDNLVTLSRRSGWGESYSWSGTWVGGPKRPCPEATLDFFTHLGASSKRIYYTDAIVCHGNGTRLGNSWLLNDATHLWGTKIIKCQMRPTIEIVVDHSSDNKTIELHSLRTFDKSPIVVNWGEGPLEYYESNSASEIQSIRHTYTTGASHTITIMGFVPYFGEFSATSGELVKSFVFTASTGLRAFGYGAFQNCTNLELIRCISDDDSRFEMKGVIPGPSGFITSADLAQALKNTGYNKYRVRIKGADEILTSDTNFVLLRNYPAGKVFRNHKSSDYIGSSAHGQFGFSYQGDWALQEAYSLKSSATGAGGYLKIWPRIAGSNTLQGYNEAPWLSLPESRGNPYIYAVNLRDVVALSTLGAYAFARCHNLSAVIWNDGLAKIGRRAFYESGLTEFGKIPAHCTQFGQECFATIMPHLYIEFECPLEQLVFSGAVFREFRPYGETIAEVKMTNNTNLPDAVLPTYFPRPVSWSFTGFGQTCPIGYVYESIRYIVNGKVFSPYRSGSGSIDWKRVQ